MKKQKELTPEQQRNKLETDVTFDSITALASALFCGWFLNGAINEKDVVDVFMSVVFAISAVYFSRARFKDLKKLRDFDNQR